MKPVPPVPLPLPRRPAAAGAQRAPQRTAVGRPEAEVDRQAAADGFSGLINGHFRILDWRYLVYIWPYMVQYLQFRILK